ncbi:mRNA-binding ribosome synthesis protein nop7 [Coemansia sp. RSA 1813]|nr:mRNA-binding ribosome synthesis protein nop7 [Coemansia sp. RSA 1646]KAJ1774063.1 mRNA-binding ribosome synthesis protein nop7 [Coemansia sp. RSA 1843]KAJ2092546.1 mRNA-binding ribosome synthesis protein nop7 [Coemansia sp. RSA 986]KAJ2216759.1 mRNA-binding ribosome synthesis protein nop7 [Coemansia sp. RSA 487]KAJ2572831.1 mRNA-binding ribosome synthesis protein nop7 [Coemansia sp. RSA 1813]
MGKIKKKYTEGASRTYITRNRAIKRLQLSLPDFRRLSILKGIYPVEPRSRKKANRGSAKATTFYYSKDIQSLLNEPLIAKFREHKIFLRKLQHALGKDDLTRAKTLEANRPQYSLDHLVIERYPTFVDAMRDLDDALCMVTLFSTMPVVRRINKDTIDECRRLASEFMHYVIHTHCLRKVFLSIKGIYYQADIQGQSITWLVPYQFSQNLPRNVDFKVMSTFLQFYRTLLGFVNYRLFTVSNLAYPPKIDRVLDDSAAGLGSLKIESSRIEDLVNPAVQDKVDSKDNEDAAAGESAEVSSEMKQRLSTLDKKIESIVLATAANSAQEPAYESLDSGTTAADNDGDDQAQLESLLFGKQVFFLSREVPRYSLEFVIRAFGGRLGWDNSSGGGSPYAENDSAITIQIADRPVQGHQFLNRTYVQPQWVYDSINARRMLSVDNYLVGQPLPPHLSPFVEYAEGDYVPEAAAKLAAAAGFEGEVTNLKPEDRDENENESEDDAAENVEGESADEEEAEDSDSGEGSEDDDDAKAEKEYQKQLIAERAGMSYSEYQQEKHDNKKTKNATVSKKSNARKRTKAEIEEEERQKIAISMLSKKKRKVVNRANAEAYKRAKDVNTLMERRKDAAASKKTRK